MNVQVLQHDHDFYNILKLLTHFELRCSISNDHNKIKQLRRATFLLSQPTPLTKKSAEVACENDAVG